MKRLFFAIVFSFSALFAANQDSSSESVNRSNTNTLPVEEYKKSFKDISQKDLIDMMVAGAGNKFPQRLDEITVLNSVKAKGNSIVYEYILEDIPAYNIAGFTPEQKNAFENVLKTQIGSLVCRTNAVLAVFDRDIKFDYNYFLNGKEYAKFIYDKDECQKFNSAR